MTEPWIKQVRKHVDDLRWTYLHPTLEGDSVTSCNRADRQRQQLFEQYTKALYELVCEHLRHPGWYLAYGRDDAGRWRWSIAEQAFVFEYRTFADMTAPQMPDEDRCMHCSIQLRLDPDVDLDQELNRLAGEAEIYRVGVKALELRVRTHPHRNAVDRSPPTDEGYQLVERVVLDNKSFDDFSAVLENPPPPNKALKALFRDEPDDEDVGPKLGDNIMRVPVSMNKTED